MGPTWATFPHVELGAIEPEINGKTNSASVVDVPSLQKVFGTLE
jgi:hypothetical protein